MKKATVALTLAVTLGVSGLALADGWDYHKCSSRHARPCKETMARRNAAADTSAQTSKEAVICAKPGTAKDTGEIIINRPPKWHFGRGTVVHVTR